MQYATHYEEGKKVSFKKFDLNLAGLLFLPDGFDADAKYPAVVVTHPGGGVKEQCSSLYAWHLARAGYVALAFDASHQGESEGLPRCLEDPFSRVEDIRSAVDYLVTLPYVDEERIGAMGVCAGGGYTMSAIQTDVRIKAAAGISTWDVGDSARNGFPGVEIENFMQKLLQEVARARTAAARGEEAPCWKYVPDGPDEIDEHTSVIQREAYEYYRTPRCSYPTSVNRYLVSSNDKLAAFDALPIWIRCRPVLCCSSWAAGRIRSISRKMPTGGPGSPRRSIWWKEPATWTCTTSRNTSLRWWKP